MKIKLLNEKAVVPQYGTKGSVGLDLRACIPSVITLHPKATVMIPTGIAIYIEDIKIAGMIYPRSGLGHKHGIVLGNLTGVIDSDYQGEIMLSLWNRGSKPYTINDGDRLAQLVFMPVVKPDFEIVTSFNETMRGEDGFGSTGIK